VALYEIRIEIFQGSCPNIGSRRLGADTEFPIIAQCKPPVQILKGFC